MFKRTGALLGGMLLAFAMPASVANGQDILKTTIEVPGKALIERVEQALTARRLLGGDLSTLVRLYQVKPDHTEVNVMILKTVGDGPNLEIEGRPYNSGTWKAGAYGIRWQGFEYRPDTTNGSCRSGWAVYDLEANTITSSYCLPKAWSNPSA